MKKQEISVFQAMDRMVKDDNHGIQMSNTIANVKFVTQGSIIGFGVENNIGNDANFQVNSGLPGEYMIFCLAVKRTELDKTKHLMMQEQFEQQEKAE